ncbi:MAG: PAS domain-containing protein, partial [Thermoplasmatota archaeon]
SFDVIPLNGPTLKDRYFLVVFAPESKTTGRGGRAGSGPARRFGGLLPGEPRREKDRRIDDLTRELAALRDRLRRLSEEFEMANQELRSANEEALSANEELQSTNEELETAKEELQSTNEELLTLNAELQQRNLDVQKINNDLVNLLNSTLLPLVMLGPDLRIRRFTPEAEALLNLIPTDIGRPLTDLALPFDVAELRGAVVEVLTKLSVREVVTRDSRGREYELKIHPYRTTDHRIDGTVLVFREIGPTARRSA